MLGKLKISSDILTDSEVVKILNDWFLDFKGKGESHSLDEVHNLEKWYKNRGLNKGEKPGNIFRGLRLDLNVKTLLAKGEVSIKNTGYDSWSVSSNVAQVYADLGVGGKDGLILSQKLKGRYFDINKAVNYLELKVEQDGKKINKLRAIYDRQCEIITLSPCTKCVLDENIECLLPSIDFALNLLEYLDKYEWSYDKKYPFFNYCILNFKEKSAKLYDDFADVYKDFRLKDTDRCERD